MGPFKVLTWYVDWLPMKNNKIIIVEKCSNAIYTNVDNVVC